jgi:aminoglycoside/choline kinase family phosphotransferase
MAQEKIKQLFIEYTGEEPTKITPLARSGSDREYFRITSEKHSLLGVYNPDRKENLAFVEFTKHFYKKGLKVPQIIAEQLADDIYLIEDLGHQNLFQYLSAEKKKGEFTDALQANYEKVLKALPKFQIEAAKDLDYSLCYPRASFDKTSMMWDLNYFKYYFLKLAGIPFDEQALENDFKTFVDFLLEADRDYFLYRDFQSRNIMIHEDQPYFIDYQGGRKGALQYDLASLLYDAKAGIPQSKREELYKFYVNELKNFIEVDEQKFEQHYQGYVLIRIMQAMGAYGFRGFYEKKAHFLASIPYALDNMKFILQNFQIPLELPTLRPLLEKLVESDKLREIAGQAQQLTISVNSFSFKRGVPVDESGNGGGHVFDCRALPNPGREEQYRSLTGKDLAVIEYLKKEPEVERFIYMVYAIIRQSVQNYLERGFDNLMINFGCTGGQHRSVYSAENIARMIKDEFNVNVVLRHREQEMNPAHKK